VKNAKKGAGRVDSYDDLIDDALDRRDFAEVKRLSEAKREAEKKAGIKLFVRQDVYGPLAVLEDGGLRNMRTGEEIARTP